MKVDDLLKPLAAEWELQRPLLFEPSVREDQRNRHEGLGRRAIAAMAALSGAVAGLVGIEVGVVSGVSNLESPGVSAPDRRLRHEEAYHAA